MLQLSLQSIEIFDEGKEEFKTIGGIDIELEHSLYTIALWESKTKKPFAQSDMDTTFILDYIKCMCMTKGVSDEVWVCMTPSQISQILSYIQDTQTATTIKTQNKPGRKRIITAELIYSWMFQLQIPLECEHWHFNRLLTLIEVCSIESQPPKKMGKKAAYQQQRQLNAARRAQYNSKG